ncbi:MAG: alpha amylase C-terminal domain-containing protein [Planctomycetota bacterium]
MFNRSLAIALVSAAAGTALAAAPDNNVEWDGISHWAQHDLRPLVPLDRESFKVRLKALANDLTSVSVTFANGAVGTVPATKVGFDRGYDIWEAEIPASSIDDVSYYFTVTDGTDSDYLSVNGVQEAIPSQNVSFGVDFANLTHAPYGATPVEGGTVFRVWAPNPSQAHVIGYFNNAQDTDALSRVGSDFIGFVEGVGAGDAYKYLFDRNLEKPDARAKSLVPINFGWPNSDTYASIVIDPLGYQWTSNDYVPPAPESVVAYQLHVGTFAGFRDPVGSASDPSHYRDVADRVQHLKDLGVNLVYLNPVNEFPGEKSGGYNPLSAFAIEGDLADSRYEAHNDFKFMVDTLHANGIAVILDVVWNHFDSFQNFLWNYDGGQIYFDAPAEVGTPWGPQADFNRAEVRSYFNDASRYFADELRLDGVRFDAAMYMAYSNLTPQWFHGQNILKEMNDTFDRRSGGGYTVAEIYDNASINTAATSVGGYGFDGQYHEAFKNAIRDAVFGAAFGSADMNRLAGTLNGTGGATGVAAFNYFELHDDAWPLNGHERAVKEIDTSFPHDDEFAKGRVKVGNSVTLFAQGVPGILQGTEWLEDSGWENFRIDWWHLGRYDEIFRYYQTAIDIRTSRPELFADAPISVYHVNDGGDVIAFERFIFGGGSYVIVMNLSNTDYNNYQLGIPRPGEWGAILNSDARRFDGNGFGEDGPISVVPTPRDGKAQSAALDIPANGILVLQLDPVYPDCGPADLAPPYGVSDLDDLDRFINAFLGPFALLEPGADSAEPFGLLDLDDIDAFIGAFLQGCR